MAAVLFHNPVFGTTIESGYELYFYEVGTTTDLTVYLDAGLSATATQPVVADPPGRFAPIYFDATSNNPKVVLKDPSTGQIWTVDEYPIEDTASIAADLGQAQTDIIALDGRLTTAESDIDTLQAESTDYESRISTLEGVDNSGNVSESTFTGAQSIAAAGYQDLPGGLIMQWGSDTAPANGTSSNLSFPKAFPTACLSVVSNRNSSRADSNDGNAAGVILVSKSQYQVYNDDDETPTVYWFAVGY